MRRFHALIFTSIYFYLRKINQATVIKTKFWLVTKFKTFIFKKLFKLKPCTCIRDVRSFHKKVFVFEIIETTKNLQSTTQKRISLHKKSRRLWTSLYSILNFCQNNQRIEESLINVFESYLLHCLATIDFNNIDNPPSIRSQISFEY